MTKPSLRKSLIALLMLIAPALVPMARPQSPGGELRGTVTDPSGALVPSATVMLSGQDGYSRSVQSAHDGTYAFTSVPAGNYSVSITADGFASASVQDARVISGKTTVENFGLHLPVEEQQVEVKEENQGVNMSADNNASAIVIKGKDLDALSDDPDELQSELNALAGPAAGPNGAQIFIDGFSGGQLPPKSSIREIRINQNPFSAQYDKLGYGRIEILSKPGTDKLHGSVMMMGNSSAFNSLNPFVTEEPSYYSTFFVGNAGGSLGKSASWFGSIFRRDNATNSIINAVVPGPDSNPYDYTAAVANPQSRLDISPRMDFQLGPSNTLTVRYMFDRQKETNSGVSQFALETQGYNILNHENTIQLSDTQVLGANTVNEVRFQYIGDRNSQVSQYTDPTITVQGAFTGGGNNEGVVRDHQDRFELQDYTTMAKGAHALNFGGRLRLTHDVSYSTSGFNGHYIYSSLDAYSAKTPSEYDVTAGKTTVEMNLSDAGLFFQDDYKARPNLTLSYGVRYEAQTSIGDHNDWGPRLSLAWAPHTGAGSAKTVIRAGYGWFFDRFNSTYILNATRQNGINQQQYVVKNPTFYENAPPPSNLAALNTGAPTYYQVAPDLRAAVSMQAALGVEHQFGKVATASATYINSHGAHQFLSNNINAFLPGTYDQTTGTGTRPNGIDENIYQYQSEGVYNQNQLVLNYTVRAKRMSLFGFYMVNVAHLGSNLLPRQPVRPARRLWKIDIRYT